MFYWGTQVLNRVKMVSKKKIDNLSDKIQIACIKNIKTKWYKLQHTHILESIAWLIFPLIHSINSFFFSKWFIFEENIQRCVYLYSMRCSKWSCENSSENYYNFNPMRKLRIIKSQIYLISAYKNWI